MPTRCEHEVAVPVVDPFSLPVHRGDDTAWHHSYHIRWICRCPEAPHAFRMRANAIQDCELGTEESGCELRCKYFKTASVPNRLPPAAT
jgi:hypothetical protein